MEAKRTPGVVSADLLHPGRVQGLGRPFIAMEYLEGATLRDRIAGKAMAHDVMLELAIQLADGLAAAHEGTWFIATSSLRAASRWRQKPAPRTPTASRRPSHRCIAWSAIARKA